MSKNMVRFCTIIAAIFCLLWLIGLGLSVSEYYAGKPDKVPSASEQSPKKAENKKGLNVVALGDSLTRGTGDETGKGYVGVLVDELKEKTKQPVQLTNLGINGQRSDQLREQVQQTEVGRQIQKADVVLVTIGGNDLFRGGQGIIDFNKDLTGIQTKYLDNLKFIFENIRKNNQDANVFFIGLYNPFIELGEGKEMSKVVRQWNYQSAEVSAGYPKIVFVPTFDLFELKVNDYLYSDKFHPNTKGYRLISERVASLITW